MQDFGQWLPQSQSSGDLYFSSMMSSQLDTSLEMQTRNSAVALLEKESAHPFGIRSAAGPIELTRNDAGTIEDVQNGAGPTEVIDLNNTPPPKAKRKKHRPKVFKPPKTPKSATPKPNKAKEEKPSGKRKYVRKNTPAGQPPPEQTGDSHCRPKPKSAKRCLNIDGDVARESTHPGSQAQLISTDPKDYQQSESSTSQSNVQTQLPCHVGFTTSSMYSSANQMAGAQLLPADNTETAIYSSANEMANAQFLPARYMPKGVLLDLNSSMDQRQNEYANFVDRPEQFFQSGVMETLQKDPLLELSTAMPGKNLPDLNSSISLMQGMPTNFTEYLLSSPQASVRETQMDKQMLNCHRIPENSITTAQYSEGVAIRENFNPNPYSREAWATDQISHGYRSTQNPISSPKHIEGHSVVANLNELTAVDSYLKFTTSSYMQTGGALGPHGSRSSSHMHVPETRGEHNASNGAHSSLGVNFDQQRNRWASVDACHVGTSQGSYFPENYKRMRTDNHSNGLNGAVGDRRFSPWKGSVVDSVVGVFLTQNVSDHLSSSAFMALAAKFPAKPEVSRIPASRMFHSMSEENGDCSGLFGDSVKLQGGILVEEASNTTSSLVTTEEKEGSNSIGLFGNSPGDGVDCAAGVYYNSYGTLPVRLHESKTLAAGTESVVEVEDVALEDVVSSQNSAISSQSSPDYLFNMTDHMFPSTYVNFTAEDLGCRNMPNGTSNSTTYTELLRMQELKSKLNEKIGLSEYDRVPEPCTNKGSMPSEVHNLSSKRQSLHASVSCHQNGQAHLPDITYASYLERSVYTGLSRTDDYNATPAETRFDCHLSSPGVDSDKTKMADSLTALLCDIDGSLSQDKIHFPSATTRGADFISPIMNTYFHPSSSETVSFAKEQSIENNLSRNNAVAPFVEQHVTPNLQEESTTKAKQIRGEKHQSGCSQQYGNVGLLKNKDGSHYSSNLYQSGKANSELLQGVASDSIEKPRDNNKAFPEVPADGSKTKKARVGARKKRTYDWDILRKEVLVNRGNEERSQNAKDALDWETIRQIDVKEISDTIRERGMNNMLSERIKAFLNRLVTDHGAIDLEWLRHVDPDKAKEYLLSIRGLGLKSVECVRLLTLHHMAFPVDTNVGRICVRLGWVPLQPLPESLQLHLLELYPMLENIQKYLWPRLCKLDQRTLYELHYQMITFGKVFCTKSKPNCNACPMRAECKHFASAFASARLALPGPEEKSLVKSGNPIAAESCHQPYISSRPVNQLDWNAHAHDHVLDNRQPIIEEPASPEPEPETAEIKESAIEDMFFDDPDEIPTIKLNFEQFAQNLKNYMQVNNIEIEEADMSSALVAITPEAASIPTPRLKNISRLRTEHQVYELPDSHPLLEGYDQREPDDPCPYLLSIWTPGETAQSTDAPKTSCNSYESGKLCDSSACFSCNSIREAQAQKVRGTILIPCRTAMRGSFPLNGTYFQVNEVFADHDSSRNPVDVPRNWIWDLPKRTVYFGTSTPSIFKGLTTEEIQHCFWRGFVCVRGFDRISRAPRPLYARLHFPASKITRNKKDAAFAATDDA